MNVVTEEIQTKNDVLILSPETTPFIQALKSKLQEYDGNVYISNKLNLNKDWDYIFIFHPELYEEILAQYVQPTKLILVYRQKKPPRENPVFFDARHVYLQTSEQFHHQDVEALVWFAFVEKEMTELEIVRPKMYKTPVKGEKRDYLKEQIKKPKVIALALLTLTILAHLLFVPFLAAASFYNYKAYIAFKMNEESESLLEASDRHLQNSARFYRLVRPTYSALYLSFPFDSAFEVNNAASELITNMKNLAAIVRQDPQVLGATSEEDPFENVLEKIDQNVEVLGSSIPNFGKGREIKKELQNYEESLDILRQFSPFINQLGGVYDSKKYLLLFANDMELRPGGGFIGSFATAEIQNFRISDFQVFDVYDADGQLKEQIDPPAAIVDHLNQTHWFLRDSAFTPDFKKNYEQSLVFLEKELGMTNFDGGMLITTTAVKNLLQAFDNLYIPDHQETITSDNFYLKTQIYSEQNSFAGSRQKQSIVTDVFNALLIRLEEANPAILIEQFHESLDNKQIVMFSNNPDVQQVVEDNFWAGRVLQPQCNLPSSVNCVLDYVFPVDANLGVNKANYFVTRSAAMDINIQENGKITNTLRFTYKNESLQNVYPGGRYKNYFQLMLPPNSTVDEVLINNKPVDEYDETNLDYKTVGILIQTQPQEEDTLSITYTLPTRIVSGSGTYQLILQKQIGFPNEQFQLSISSPETFEIRPRNFTPLVNDGKIHYNTQVSADTILLFEFEKQT